MVPIVGLEPTYSRFLNSFKAPSESLNGISGQIAFGTYLFVLKWADRCLSFQTVRVSVLIDAKSATLTKKRWWTMLDLNQQPTGYEPVALTNLRQWSISGREYRA